MHQTPTLALAYRYIRQYEPWEFIQRVVVLAQLRLNMNIEVRRACIVHGCSISDSMTARNRVRI